MAHTKKTNKKMLLYIGHIETRGCCGRDRMVVGFTTTYAISACRH